MLKNKGNKSIVGNKGFTLVELLVGVAILAIASVGLIQAFTIAGITNAKAQKKQNATSLAESVMEEIKSSSVTQLKSRYVTPSGDITEGGVVVTDSAFYGKTARERAEIASALVSGSQGFLCHETAKPYYYVLCKKGQSVTVDPTVPGNDTYTVTATMRTEPYSKTTPSGGAPITNASNANTIKLPVIEDIDAHKKTVLSGKELNKFDVAAAEYFNMHGWFDADDSLDPSTMKVKKKEIVIEKTGDGAAETTDPIRVTCSVIYTSGDGSTQYKKDVFNGTYASEKDSEGNFVKVDNDIYIFYNRFLLSDELITIKDKSKNDAHRVYLILQNKLKKDTDSGDHPVLKDGDEITDLNGTTVTIYKATPAETEGDPDVLTEEISADSNDDVRYTKDGEEIFGRKKVTDSITHEDYWLITNLNDFSEKSSKNRLFEVTVEVTKPDDDTVYATLTSTVDARE